LCFYFPIKYEIRQNIFGESTDTFLKYNAKIKIDLFQKCLILSRLRYYGACGKIKIIIARNNVLGRPKIKNKNIRFIINGL